VVLSLPKGSSETWQFKFITALAKEQYPEASDKQEINLLLSVARYESRLGVHILRAFRKYLCNGDSKKIVNGAISAAKNVTSKKRQLRPVHEKTRTGHLQSSDVTIGAMKCQAASLVAAAVVQVIPAHLTIYAFPLVGGVAFMLLHVGIDGFCEWCKEMEMDETQRRGEEGDRA
jgi:hypothetical protein